MFDWLFEGRLTIYALLALAAGVLLALWWRDRKNGYLHGAADVSRRSARRRAVAHIHAELGGQDNLVPAFLHDLAEQLLARPLTAVDVGGVKESDPGLQACVDDRAGPSEIQTPTAQMAAELKRGSTKSRPTSSSGTGKR